MALRAEEIRQDSVDLDRDRALVLRYQQGDEGAFDELFRRYYPRLHVYCRRRVGDNHVAEELAQEAFLRALRAMPRFAGERRFYPWMTVIAQRLCIDHHRSASRVEPAADVDTGSVDADPGDVFAAVDRGHLVAALDRVAPRHREVLQLREQEGWSYQQIAGHLDVPVTTVEALLHRARKALRREFLAVGGGRLGSLPIFGGLAAALARLRLRAAGSTAGQHVPQLAAAGLAAVTLAAAPFVLGGGGDTRSGLNTTSTGASPSTVAISTTGPAPDAPVAVVAAPPTAAAVPASTAPPSASSDAPAGTDLGIATVWTTPDGADHAGDTAEGMPIHLAPAPDLRVGVDPAAIIDRLLATLGGTP